MRRLASIALTLLVASCASDSFRPPPVSPALVARAGSASAAELAYGRQLFVTRCIECHTLPPVAKYSREQWPKLVARMSVRANLTADEHHAIVAYLRAAAQK